MHRYIFKRGGKRCVEELENSLKMRQGKKARRLFSYFFIGGKRRVDELNYFLKSGKRRAAKIQIQKRRVVKFFEYTPFSSLVEFHSIDFSQKFVK